MATYNTPFEMQHSIEMAQIFSDVVSVYMYRLYSVTLGWTLVGTVETEVCEGGGDPFYKVGLGDEVTPPPPPLSAPPPPAPNLHT